MRRILVNTIKGNEKLARDIINGNGIVLMSVGSELKKQYIKRLLELDIMYVYIEDELSKGIEMENNIELTILEQCKDITRDIIEKYSFQGHGELEDIQYVAEDIINDVIKQPEIMYNVTGIRNKSESTYSHSINVCALAVLLALRMKLSKVRVRDIAVGSLLHDIGYVSMSNEYLNNPSGEYNEDAKELMKHVIYGYEIVSKENWLTNASKDIILCHHERLDGSGYPFHINKEKIKIGSKIVAICDDFDSMVYGHLTNQMKVHDVLNYIISQAGVKYEFDCVNYFIESVAAYPNGTLVLTNEGETGIVLRQNVKCPTRPVLHMITNSQGKKYTTWVEKDLKKELTLFIRDTIEE